MEIFKTHFRNRVNDNIVISIHDVRVIILSHISHTCITLSTVYIELILLNDI